MFLKQGTENANELSKWDREYRSDDMPQSWFAESIEQWIGIQSAQKAEENSI